MHISRSSGFWLLRAGNGQRQSTVNVNGICSLFQRLIDGGTVSARLDSMDRVSLAPALGGGRPINAEWGRWA
jgi:hypothetical protein